jgi:SAGA-associated factor 73
MGAKRAVQGRSRNYDELLMDWQRANNPNFVEPVKRETKAEKKEKREKEKMEKKRLAGEAAAASGIDPATGKKTGVIGISGKKGKKAAAAAAAAARSAEGLGEDIPENLDDLDSEAEVDDLVRVIRAARERGVVAVPLAVPCDAGSWFVQRRERARNCRDLLVGALGSGGGTGVPGGIGSMGMVGRTGSMSLGVGVGIGGGRLG